MIAIGKGGERGIVLASANLETKIFEAGNNVTTDHTIAFTDSSGEDEGVDTLERGSELADDD